MQPNVAVALDTIVSNGTHVTGVRLTPHSVFVREHSLDYLASQLANVLSHGVNGDILKRVEKDCASQMRRHPMFYLVEEHTNAGYLLPIPTTREVPKPRLVSCRDYLLKEDPKFKNHRAITLHCTSEFVASMRVHDVEYLITQNAFAQFVQSIRSCDPVQRMCNSKFEYKRDCLDMMYKLLCETHFTNGPQSPETTYRLGQGFIFEIGEGNRVVNAYYVGKHGWKWAQPPPVPREHPRYQYAGRTGNCGWQGSNLRRH
jgi:hypothetical protein